jgi:hypothetical protein
MHFVHASPFFFCPRGGYCYRWREPHFGHPLFRMASNSVVLGGGTFDPRRWRILRSSFSISVLLLLSSVVRRRPATYAFERVYGVEKAPRGEVAARGAGAPLWRIRSRPSCSL